MAKRQFELYLDESGAFEDRAAPRSASGENSLVGGLLMDAGVLTDALVESLLPEKVHCSEQTGYDKDRCLCALEVMKDKGARFILFENRERISILNGDTTYLNILAEGLTQLFSDLLLSYPGDTVSVEVIIAMRKNVTQGHGILKPQEYKERLEEKLLLSAHKEGKRFCQYELYFEDARSFRRLDLADIICNTYYTRKRKNKFSPEEMERISALFAGASVYSVFEAATVGYLKRLLSEKQFGEAVLQLCLLPTLKDVGEFRNMLVEQASLSSLPEVNACFSYLSLQLEKLTNDRDYQTGIALAENYKEYFLTPLYKTGRAPESLDYWRFDTDFFLLTMYDHVGNMAKCSEYLELCRKRISAINHSWEYLSYYLRFRVRELLVLQGRFDFEQVIEKAEELEKILQNAKELFGLIETFDDTPKELNSELLGKVCGVKVEAYTNLLYKHPELLEKAISASDTALSEFTASEDLSRQYQYRCALLTEAGDEEEALKSLFLIFELDEGKREISDFRAFVASAFSRRKPDEFALWHYLELMLLLKKKRSALAGVMADAIINYPEFANAVKDTEKQGHPWNLVLWKLGQWYLESGSSKKAGLALLQRAIEVTVADPELITMKAFAISMYADLILYYKKDGLRSEISRCFTSMRKIAAELPEIAQAHFAVPESEPDNSALERIKRVYLK